MAGAGVPGTACNGCAGVVVDGTVVVAGGIVVDGAVTVGAGTVVDGVVNGAVGAAGAAVGGAVVDGNAGVADGAVIDGTAGVVVGGSADVVAWATTATIFVEPSVRELVELGALSAGFSLNAGDIRSVSVPSPVVPGVGRENAICIHTVAKANAKMAESVQIRILFTSIPLSAGSRQTPFLGVAYHRSERIQPLPFVVRGLSSFSQWTRIGSDISSDTRGLSLQNAFVRRRRYLGS
jgi:hypothetical protein